MPDWLLRRARLLSAAAGRIRVSLVRGRGARTGLSCLGPQLSGCSHHGLPSLFLMGSPVPCSVQHVLAQLHRPVPGPANAAPLLDNPCDGDGDFPRQHTMSISMDFSRVVSRPRIPRRDPDVGRHSAPCLDSSATRGRGCTATRGADASLSFRKADPGHCPGGAHTKPAQSFLVGPV